MKKTIAVVAVLIGIGVIAALLFGNPGKKEFQKQLDALQTVKSWRMDLQISRSGHLLARRTHEAHCPDMEHIQENGLEGVGEYIRLVNSVYYRKGMGRWTNDINVPQDLFMPFSTPRPCMSNPGGSVSAADSGDTEWRDELKRAMKDGTFTKGDAETVGGTSCRNWQVSWINKREQMVAYTMCLGEQDHLPRRIRSAGDNLNMYFEWNVPIDVTAPDMTPPAPLAPLSSTNPGADSYE